MPARFLFRLVCPFPNPGQTARIIWKQGVVVPGIVRCYLSLEMDNNSSIRIIFDIWLNFGSCFWKETVDYNSYEKPEKNGAVSASLNRLPQIEFKAVYEVLERLSWWCVSESWGRLNNDSLVIGAGLSRMIEFFMNYALSSLLILVSLYWITRNGYKIHVEVNPNARQRGYFLGLNHNIWYSKLRRSLEQRCIWVFDAAALELTK